MIIQFSVILRHLQTRRGDLLFSHVFRRQYRRKSSPNALRIPNSPKTEIADKTTEFRIFGVPESFENTGPVVIITNS